MHDVNNQQVGGDHYALGGNCQHWDFVEVNGMGYLEGCATKYVTRWRRKNGVQDLEKALHYIDKLLALAEEGHIVKVLGVKLWKTKRHNRVSLVAIPAARFAEHNGLFREEERVCHLLLTWHLTDHLHEARHLVNRMIEHTHTAMKRSLTAVAVPRRL